MVGLVPAIHAFSEFKEDVDVRDTGKRKRCRSSNGYARA